MVKQGKYGVEIINEETKIAFPEHKSETGETYVEVEPEAEYKLRIKTEGEEKVRVDFSVDGSSLDYHCTISKRDPPQDKGLWEYKDGKSYQHALKFAKAQVRQPTGNEANAPNFWTGKVEVTFSEAVFKGYKEQSDHSSTWNGGDVSFVMGISDPDKKKGVKSDKGESFACRKSKRRRKTYTKGGVLSTITLRYCSTLGLIHAGVLTKPPMWDMHRLANPVEESQQNAPEPDTSVKGEGGGQVEVFDLTED